MSKRCFAPLAFAAMLTFVPPAIGETTSHVKAGVLTCKLAPSIGLIIGSQQSMSCRYTPNSQHPPETYTGTMGTIGLDIGVTAGGELAWAVLAPTDAPPPGALAGTYVGATGDASFGVGAGANVLVGGSAHTVSLQPLSVEGEAGVNLALGVSGLTLTWVR
jgi:Protein of unknown function (DUF992)